MELVKAHHGKTEGELAYAHRMNMNVFIAF